MLEDVISPNLGFPNEEVKYQQKMEEMKNLVPYLKEEMKSCPVDDYIFTLIETIDFYSLKRYFKLKESTHSMPSGDSLQAGIFATMIILYTNNFFKFFGILLIPAAMLGRVFYNLHYWFDCIIGAIMGIFISIGTYTIINKYFLNI